MNIINCKENGASQSQEAMDAMTQQSTQKFYLKIDEIFDRVRESSTGEFLKSPVNKIHKIKCKFLTVVDNDNLKNISKCQYCGFIKDEKHQKKCQEKQSQKIYNTMFKVELLNGEKIELALTDENFKRFYGWKDGSD